MKVHELARDKGLTPTDVLRAAKRLGFPEIDHHMKDVTDEQADMIVETVALGVPDEKPATKPWNADSNPWALDMLKLQRKRPGFRVKFVTRDNLQRRLDEGWKIAEKKYYGGLSATLPGEESTEDSYVKRRELILMEMPEELARKRDEYIRHKTNLRSTTVNDIRRQVGNVERELGQSVHFEGHHDNKPGY